MRPVNKITAEAENFRVEPFAGHPGVGMIKRDPVEPEPVGTIVLAAFRITGYDADCDGSLMARLEQIDEEGDATGVEMNQGLYPCTHLVVTPEEFQKLFRRPSEPPSAS